MVMCAFLVDQVPTANSLFPDYATVAISAIALFIAFYTAWISRRSVIANSISAQRIEWIGEVRNLIGDFASEYRNNPTNKNHLIELYTRIVLYFNPNSPDYIGIVDSMKACIDCREYSIDLYWNVISHGQTLLDISWRRMKREAGVSYDRENRNTKKLQSERKRREKKQGTSAPAWSANHSIDIQPYSLNCEINSSSR